MSILRLVSKVRMQNSGPVLVCCNTPDPKSLRRVQLLLSLLCKFGSCIDIGNGDEASVVGGMFLLRAADFYLPAHSNISQ